MSFQKPAAAASGSAQLASNIATFKQNLEKLESSSQDASKWREADRAVKLLDSLSATISANLKTANDANVSDLRRQFAALNERCQSAKAAYAQKKEQAEAAPDGAAGAGGPAAQQAELQQIQDDTSRLQFLERETGQILESQKVINQLTQQVGEVIDRDHEKVVHIDETIEDAKDDMVTGNEELAAAEEHQKACDVA
jgi:hypothetical protein